MTMRRLGWTALLAATAALSACKKPETPPAKPAAPPASAALFLLATSRTAFRSLGLAFGFRGILGLGPERAADLAVRERAAAGRLRRECASRRRRAVATRSDGGRRARLRLLKAMRARWSSPLARYRGGLVVQTLLAIFHSPSIFSSTK